MGSDKTMLGKGDPGCLAIVLTKLACYCQQLDLFKPANIVSFSTSVELCTGKLTPLISVHVDTYHFALDTMKCTQYESNDGYDLVYALNKGAIGS